jgi:outer membrane protein OmpA-like peptidoglycan-associated protein
MPTFVFTRAVTLTATVALLAACAQDPEQPRTVGRGTAIGLAAGVATGAVLGNVLAASGRAAAGTAIGAAIGAALAGGAGLAMDRQRRDFEDQLAEERAQNAVQVEQLRGDVLVLTLDSEVQFATSSAAVKPGFERTLTKVANVLQRHPGTEITVIGHTDSTGSDAYNQRLSQRRAEAVRDRLVAGGVPADQLSTVGRGSLEPRADNATPEGRAANRRVEMVLTRPA